MIQPDPTPGQNTRERAAVGRVLTWWFCLMSGAGLLSGAMSETWRAGNDGRANPLVIVVVMMGIALVAARIALRRARPGLPVDRLLLVGCGIGVIALAIGFWFGANLGAMR